VLEAVAPAQFLDPEGPDTWPAHTDLTGDGHDEALLCVTVFTPGGPFTSIVIFSYHGGAPSTVLADALVPWALFTREGDTLIGSRRLALEGGVCEAVISKCYGWNGTELVIAREDVWTRSGGESCGPPGG
jgi:hypothetical protein